jgi:hypothetical protein
MTLDWFNYALWVVVDIWFVVAFFKLLSAKNSKKDENKIKGGWASFTDFAYYPTTVAVSVVAADASRLFWGGNGLYFLTDKGVFAFEVFLIFVLMGKFSKAILSFQDLAPTEFLKALGALMIPLLITMIIQIESCSIAS